MENYRIERAASRLLLFGYLLGCVSSALVALGSVLRVAGAGNLPETPISGGAPSPAPTQQNTPGSRGPGYFEL